MEYQITVLSELCRFCGNYANQNKVKRPTKLCVTYADEIRALYGIDIQNDDLQVHPNKCPSCYHRFINIKHTDNNHSYVLVDYSHIEELRAIY